MREPSSPGRLVSFRLADIPLEIRLLAAKHARPSTRPALDVVQPEDRLLATLAGGNHYDLVAAAKTPSPRVYWISAGAWQAIMGDRTNRPQIA